MTKKKRYVAQPSNITDKEMSLLTEKEQIRAKNKEKYRDTLRAGQYFWDVIKNLDYHLKTLEEVKREHPSRPAGTKPSNNDTNWDDYYHNGISGSILLKESDVA